MDWEDHAEREERRYADGLERLPDDPDARQKQLVRVAMAATGAGLARLMQRRRAEAAGWFVRSAERFRESFADAPPESWGRPVGAVKARLLAGDVAGAEADARWTLEQGPDGSGSPIGRYAAALAHLVLGDDEAAGELARGLREAGDEMFPRAVADALAGLAGRDRDAYASAAAVVLRSFEERDAYLEDVPVADTVLVLQALAEPRGLAVRLRSALLPG
ncbi:MAG TPA: hypothetical protein VHF23_09370 [Gaiellaceae bacterium]|nr:hypothetical protein [Gaiellaceae bacterium]